MRNASAKVGYFADKRKYKVRISEKVCIFATHNSKNGGQAMAEKIVQIPDKQLDLFEKLVSTMGGAVKDGEEPKAVANDSLMDTVKKLFEIFDDKKIADKGLTQQDVDSGRKLVEELVDYRINVENKLLDLLTTNPPFKDDEEKAAKMSKEGRKLVKELAVLPYNHPRANIAVDVVAFGILPGKDELHVFVHKKPGKKEWWLPGRFMRCGRSFVNETDVKDKGNWTLEDTMRDALNRKWEKVKVKEETYVGGVKVSGDDEPPEIDVLYTIRPNIDLICQLEPMSAVNRDKRKMRVVSVPYMTLVFVRDESLLKGCSSFAQWKPVSELVNIKEDFQIVEKLAHDHSRILINALKRLFQEVRTRPIGGSKDVLSEDVKEKYLGKNENRGDIILDDFVMLPSEFDVYQLIDIYSVILHTMGVSVERSNLKKLLLDRAVIEEVGNRSQFGKGGNIYKFTDKYKVYRQNMNFSFNPKVKDDG